VSSVESIEFKELVRSRTDLVRLIGESVALTPRSGGRDYVGLCPFHDDHNPSFHVYPERQTYRCWACNEGGDCFSWVMRTENVGFPEALRILAERANLEMPKRGGAKPGGVSKPELYEVLAWAEREFHRCLLTAPEAEAARRYLLQDRGFTLETIEKFRLGFHPRDWEWLLRRSRGFFRPELLHAARLVRERRDGRGFRDDFVGRVLFPIRDAQGRTVAFGARVLPGDGDEAGPKYVNSPESVLFSKGRLLFGLDLARDAIRRTGLVVVMEGYTDCIVAHQYGISNVVGTLGTALTDQQAALLKRWAERVVLVYDGDVAGQTAAEKALPRLLAYDMDLRLFTLPEGQDPAEFLQARGAEAFWKLVEGAEEALEYKFRRTVARYGLESVRARERVMLDVLGLLAEAPGLAGTPREDAVLSQLAARLMVPEHSLRIHLQQARSTRRAPARPAEPAGLQRDEVARLLSGRLSADERLECDLLQLVLSVPAVFPAVREALTESDFDQPALRELFRACCRVAEQAGEPSTDRVLTWLEDAELKRLVAWLDAQAVELDWAGRVRQSVDSPAELSEAPLVRGLLERFRLRRERRRHERLRGELAQRVQQTNGLDEQAKELLRQAAEFHQRRVIHKEPLS